MLVDVHLLDDLYAERLPRHLTAEVERDELLVGRVEPEARRHGQRRAARMHACSPEKSHHKSAQNQVPASLYKFPTEQIKVIRTYLGKAPSLWLCLDVLSFQGKNK